MPWNAQDIMSLREEFVALARQEGANRRALCRRFGISPQTAYKWLARYEQEGAGGLADRSRRPHHSPSLTAAELQAAVVALRTEHPAWGGRKISRRLQDLGQAAVAPSTVSEILHRHGLIAPPSPNRQPWQRFEHETPNALWQADFKGHFPTLQGRCSPLTILDDHSRYNILLQACSNTRLGTVQGHLESAFRRYGLPARMNFDNGSPWGSPSQPGQVTELGVWLIRLGIRVSYSRPYHPQTNGKEERFHRSLAAEVLNGRRFDHLDHAQAAFDRWRQVYNHERPHEALQMQTPISRYQPSPCPFPDVLPPIEYGPDDEVVRVKWDGVLRFRGRGFKVSNALHRHDVALRPRPDEDGVFDVYFAHHRCGTIDLNPPPAAS
jgi:transposase InsO family protein